MYLFFLSYSKSFEAVLKRDGHSKVPHSRGILSLRKLESGEINPSYVYFCQHFLKTVVGMHKFNSNWQVTKLSDVASSSDEAFGLLLLENSEEKWTFEYEKISQNIEYNEADLPSCKYTSGGNNRKQTGFTRRHRGWTQAGFVRFNALVELV